MCTKLSVFCWGIVNCLVISQTAWSQQFEMVSTFAEQSELTKSNGVAVADYDLDGDLDIFIVAFNSFDKDDKSTWNRLLKNEGGTFIDFTFSAGFTQQMRRTTGGINGVKLGASWGDYDNDGYPDLFLSNFGRDELWHNNGNGSFSNVTFESGVRGCNDCYSVNGLWWDFDSDGDLDLYVSDWLLANRLYENQGDGSFSDITETSGLGDTGNTWTSLAIDVNNDSYQDLYVINDFGNNHFYLNQGDGSFIESAAEYGLEDHGEGMGGDICDYNNDGLFDIYLTNIFALQPNPFFVKNVDGKFDNRSKELGIDSAGWAWGTKFFDVDHDMDEDMYVVTGNELSGSEDFNMFFEFDNEKFHDVSAGMGVDSNLDARGLEVFDFDGDGDLDMLVSNWNGHLLLYRNQSLVVDRDKKNWIQITLEGTVSNRNAFGTVVKLKAGGKYQYRLNDGANLLGQSIIPLHFGLGSNTSIEEIMVTWPNGVSEVVTDISTNKTITLKEGSVGLVTGINDKSPLTNGSFSIINNYPSPFEDIFSLELNIPKPGPLEWFIYEASGKEIYHQQVMANTSGKFMLSSPNEMQNWKPGIYFFKMKFKNEIIDGKIMKGFKY